MPQSDAILCIVRYQSSKQASMDWKIFLTIFVMVFIAELGDKTQLATMLFATDKEVSKYTVFFAASAALVVASAIAVLAGTLLSEYINEKYLHYIAGIGFIGIGIFTLYNAYNS
jgi:putative Ca2+/H+ antiporter (TMEM165/GDT1 family)